MLFAAPALLAASAALLMIAAARDIMSRTVPNELALAVAVVGLAIRSMDGSLLFGVLAALIVFAAAAGCWRMGWMGGGDVKLLGAAALLVPPAATPSLLAAISLSGGVLAVAYLAARHRIPAPPRPRPSGLFARAARAERWRLRRGGPLPYAVAIASGAVFVLYGGGLP